MDSHKKHARGIEIDARSPVPAADSLRDLRGCGFRHLRGVLTVLAYPKSPTRGLPDQLDPVSFPAAFLQTDPNVRWGPRHAFASQNVPSRSRMV